MNIYNNWKEYDFFSNSRDVYLKEENLKVSHFGSTGAIYFTDLTNAMLTGKICKQISLDFDCNKEGSACLLINYISVLYKNNIKKLLNDLISNNTPIFYTQNGGNHEIKVSVRELPSNRVFSVFHLNRIKPLKEIPKKMTLRHAIRAIANNQITNLRCKGVYTDDYTFDNAVNYQQGILNNILFVKQLITNPSGWHVWKQESDNANKYNICCHSFNNNEFILNI